MTRLKILLYFSIIFLFVFLSKYFLLLSKKNNEAINSGEKVASIITEKFDYSQKILYFISKKISSDNIYSDPNKIHRVFVDTAYSQGYNDVFSWSMFDWVDRKDMQIVNTMTGVNTVNPPDMSTRGYTWKGRSEFWTLQFSDLTIGNPSNTRVLPVGIGVPNDNNSYIGNVVAGIDIERLRNNIQSVLEDDQDFMVINQSDYRFVFGSNNLDSINNLKNLEIYNKFSEKLNAKHEIPLLGFLEDKLVVGNETYVYARALEDKYPFIVLTGYNNKSFFQQAVSSAIDTTVTIIAILLGISIIFTLLSPRKILR